MNKDQAARELIERYVLPQLSPNALSKMMSLGSRYPYSRPELEQICLLALARSVSHDTFDTPRELPNLLQNWLEPFPLIPDADPGWPAAWQSSYRQGHWLVIADAIEMEPGHRPTNAYAALLHASASIATHDYMTATDALAPWCAEGPLAWYACWYSALAWAGLHEMEAARDALADMANADPASSHIHVPEGHAEAIRQHLPALRAWLDMEA